MHMHMASKERGGVVDSGSGMRWVGSHVVVVVGGVHHVSARWSVSVHAIRKSSIYVDFSPTVR